MVSSIIYFDEEPLLHSPFNMMLNIHGDHQRVWTIHCLHQQRNGKLFDRRRGRSWRRINLIDHSISRKSPKDQNGTNIEREDDNQPYVVTYQFTHCWKCTASIFLVLSFISRWLK